MVTIRIFGLLSIAAITMGSGGTKSSNSGTAQTDTTFEVEQSEIIDTSSEVVEPSVLSVAEQSPETLFSEADGSAGNSGSSLELALSNDYVQGRYFTGDGLLGFDQANGHVGFYFSDDRDLIGTVGLMTNPFKGLIDKLSISIGAKGYLALLASPSNDDVFAVAPGVEARYPLPIAYPVTAVGSLFYAPDILTLGDAENIVDLDLRGEAQVTQSLVGFAGYRAFRFDRDEGGGDKKAASEIQIGARFQF